LSLGELTLRLGIINSDDNLEAMTYEANKYRVRPMIKDFPRQQTERLTRLQTIQRLVRLYRNGDTAFIKDFHQRKMTKEHCEKIRQIAKLWAELDTIEDVLKTSKRNGKATSAKV
jgi:hypothetical protein